MSQDEKNIFARFHDMHDEATNLESACLLGRYQDASRLADRKQEVAGGIDQMIRYLMYLRTRIESLKID